MKGLNIVVVGGNLGNDPDLRYTPNGTAVASFSLAVNERYKSGDETQERTSWVKITVWSKLAEICDQYLGKGSSVIVRGRLQERRWEDQGGNKHSQLGVVADEVTFLDKKRDHSGYSPDDDPPF